MKTCFALVCVAGFTAAASATVIVETYGTAAPPISVGGTHPVSRAPFNPAAFSDVTSADLGSGGSVAFSSPVSVRHIGSGWATWSHGYTGHVYYSNGVTSLTMTLSSGIGAFQLYAEPNPFGVFDITATGADGGSTMSATQPTEGSAGATGWGFYTTGGTTLTTIQVSSDTDFAVGEFAHDIPTPAGFVPLGLAAMTVSRRRR